eukprot:SAG31_NODE_1665_length_7585_cov_6.666711_4_plen_209_part_00
MKFLARSGEIVLMILHMLVSYSPHDVSASTSHFNPCLVRKCTCGQLACAIRFTVLTYHRAACEPPEPEEVTVTAAITLDVGFDEIGSDPTAESYTTFVADFSADMATLLGVNEDDITVNSIVAGSVIVDFTVESTTAFVNAETVSGAFSNTGVEIAGARTTSTIAMDDITVVTPLTPDAPSKVSAAVQHNVAATPIVALAAAAVAFVA